MRQFLFGLVTAAALCGVVALSRSESGPDARAAADASELKIESGDKNPWTALKLNNDPDQFTFAVVSDRTGGHRDKVFSQAVARVNLLQPQFVMSVGDLIEGYTTKDEKIKEEWDEFDGYVKKFEMPFFYTAGNHDLANKTMVTKWGERYGKKYYSFTYKGALFLVLCSENPPTGMGTIDKEQNEWLAKTVAANKDAKWTFVFLHKPIWTAKDLEKNGWAAVEKTLAGRKYTVFCGHEHAYVRYERNGAEHFQLATTGGGSLMRGVEYGEFDHVAWITMKKDRPLIANVLLDGVLPSDLKVPESVEKGVPTKRKPTFPVSGRVTAGGQVVPGATVTLHTYNPDSERYSAVAVGRTDDMGRFQITTYAKFDGAPVGEYVVTVTKSEAVPAAFAAPATSSLKLRIFETPNTLTLDLPAK
ncbi:metallophosphoesterase [Frigoriglobus tundricola]|uniref:Calcineurin-like phosphoesterase domain-containing protein n=1 Tax=Frigoriglobus tundricola TaxID=2774151 RepID=A0A6M5Z1S7_9BACT|nr:metallophosphoesterase [Frigoriglobus tundricola]QJW99132.1 hypothetical protein FTUN_6732 [Frigoriglobus tundricola]